MIFNCSKRREAKAQKLQEEAKKKEIEATLELAKKNEGNLMPPEILRRRIERCVYTICTLERSTVLGHVYTEPLNVEQSKEKFILCVNALLFYCAWLKTSSSVYRDEGQNCVLKSEMNKDREYKWFDKYFQESLEKPFETTVKIPEVDISKGDQINFKSQYGVPIVRWLIFNNAQSFPLMISNQVSANRIYELAGIRLGFGPMSYEALFKSPIEGE